MILLQSQQSVGHIIKNGDNGDEEKDFTINFMCSYYNICIGGLRQYRRCAVSAYCRDEERFYLDGPSVYEYSQHCQVFAVLTGTISLEKGRKQFRKTLKEQEKYARCSDCYAWRSG